MMNIEQYVDRVKSFTTTCQLRYYYLLSKLPGKCRKYPNYGYTERTFNMKLYDYRQTYKHQYVPQDVDPFGADYFISMGFKHAVVPQDIYIFETLSPGSVVRILGRYNDSDWRLLWEGPPQTCPELPRKFNPPIRRLNCLVNIIRLELNRDHLLKHRTAIDAVLLKGYIFPNHLLQLKNFFRSLTGSSSVKQDIDESSVIMRLPAETILLIFQYLDIQSLSRCAQVNRTWNRISQDPILYRNLSLKRYWYKVNVGTLNYFKNRCKQLRKLDLTWCINKDEKFAESFKRFLDGYDQLTHLSLCYCPFVTVSTLEIISNHRKITELRLTHISVRYPWQFKCLSKLNKLITLDLSYTDISDVALVEILKTNPSLQHISVAFCRFIERIDYLAATVATYNKNLKNWSSLGVISTDEFAEPHFATCVDLEVLELGWCFNNSIHPGDLIEKVAVNCTNLQRLGLSSCLRLYDEHVLPIVKYCKNLTHLDMAGNCFLTSDICDKALRFLPNLRVLDIRFCSSIRTERVYMWQRYYPCVTIEHDESE